jgi:hypothetical protein
MSGLGIRLYTDEDVDAQLAVQLRRQGYDVLSCREAGRSNRGISDEDQLQFAADEGRTILVYNIGDYVELDGLWRYRDKEHAGIILASNRTPIGDLVRRTRELLDTVTPADMHNQVRWL